MIKAVFFLALKVRDDAPETPKTELPEHAMRVVWALAWPAVALNSFQVVNNVLDRGFLGRLPASAITGQSASMNITFFMFSLIMALASAPTALVSRAFGAQDHNEMRAATRQCMSMSILLGLFLGAVTVLVAHPAAVLFIDGKKDPQAIIAMTHYLRIYAIAIPAMSIINNLAAAFRGVGDTKSPMVLSSIQIVLHILLNFLLIFPTRSISFFGLFSFQMIGANMGLMGAATALTISGWISAIAYLVYSKKTVLGDCLRFTMLQASWALRIIRIALPAAANGIFRVLSMSVFTIILKNTADSSSAIAAMALGFAVESIMFMPSFGLSVAAAALVGQSLGMKAPERAERLGWMSAHMAGFITLVLCVPLAILAHPIAGVMSPGKPEIIHQTALLIQWVCATEVAFAYFGVLVGAMQGAGDTVRPFWVTIISMWCVRVPLAIVLALTTMRLSFSIPYTNISVDTGVLVVGIGWGGLGAWIAMSMSQLLQGFMAVVLFKQGAWKLKKV